MCRYAIGTFVSTQLRKVIRNKKTKLIPKIAPTFNMLLKYDTLSLSMELIFCMKLFRVTVGSCPFKQVRGLFHNVNLI